MIHDEICTYEVARLAKEKGFPQDPNKNDHSQMYSWDGLRNIHSLDVWAVWYMEEYDHDNLYAAPTQSLLQRWLREERDIHISIIANREEDDDFIWYSNEVLKDTGWSVCSWWEKPPVVRYDTYELALESALRFTLKNLI